MSVLTRDDYISRIRGRFGDEPTDDDISLIEDMTDTYDDLNTRVSDNTDWKAKYEELDKTWRKKYVDRFNGKVESDIDFVEEPTAGDNETIHEYEAPKTYEELFEVK